MHVADLDWVACMQAISDLRDNAAGSKDDDQGILDDNDEANLSPTDYQGLAFGRSPPQVKQPSLLRVLFWEAYCANMRQMLGRAIVNDHLRGIMRSSSRNLHASVFRARTSLDSTCRTKWPWASQFSLPCGLWRSHASSKRTHVLADLVLIELRDMQS